MRIWLCVGDAGSNCSNGVTCGDTVVEGSETCDDGNDNPADGCRNDCQLGYSDVLVFGATERGDFFATAARKAGFRCGGLPCPLCTAVVTCVWA